MGASAFWMRGALGGVGKIWTVMACRLPVACGVVVIAMGLWSRPLAAQPAPAEPPPEPLIADYAKFTVGPLPETLPYDKTFYKKYVDAHGIPVISSDKVPDSALLVARDIVIYMLAGRPDLRKEMISRGYRVGIMAQTEMTTDIPEQQWWFWSNYEWMDGETRMQTPEDLKAYDPRLFELLGRVYIGHRIPGDIYHGKNIRPRPRGR
jgi:hypothetical protein